MVSIHQAPSAPIKFIYLMNTHIKNKNKTQIITDIIKYTLFKAFMIYFFLPSSSDIVKDILSPFSKAYLGKHFKENKDTYIL